MQYQDERGLWRQALASMAVLAPAFSPTLAHYEAQTGLDSWHWFTLLRVLSLAPQPASLERFQAQNPYTNPARSAPYLSGRFSPPPSGRRWPACWFACGMACKGTATAHES